MKLSILIYDGFTSLDAIGGYEVLSRIPGMEVEFVAPKRGVVAADTRFLGVLAFREMAEVTSTDILYVPGGPGGVACETDEAMLGWIRALDRTSTWTVGVCNGVAILAAAGLLKGRKATTNWFYQDRLPEWGTEFLPVRYHRDGKYVTCAGVSASIDGGLFLCELIAGTDIAKTIQLGVEYYPAPPFPEKTPAEAPQDAQMILRAFDEGGGEALLQLAPAFAGSYEVLTR
ncbi:MAG TPA: DJ-1/PfpI family protein [Candidatus Binatia bacterium]|jgi:transcriptional regulator GlxA family with amidase domain